MHVFSVTVPHTNLRATAHLNSVSFMYITSLATAIYYEHGQGLL